MTDTDTDWLAAPTPDEVTDDPTSATPTETQRRTLAMRAGLLAAGAVVGGIVVTSVHHNPTTTSPTAFAAPGGGQFPLQGGPQGSTQLPPQGGPAGGFAGGLDGEEHLSGTLVSVGTSSVRVRTANGTATYLVTSSTQIVRNGRVVALSALQAGDPVLVHVYPSGSSSQLTVERLFAGLTATSQDPLSGGPAVGQTLGT